MSEKRKWGEAIHRETKRDYFTSCLLFLKWCRTMAWAGWLPNCHGE
jgi:hypothetical protein